MRLTDRQVTADELFRMPDDGFRYELVKGELRKMTPSGFEHGGLIINLAAPLAQHVKARRLGLVVGAETGFKIGRDPDTVLAPDIAFVSRNRMPSSGPPKGFWEGAPDLAVGVLSPSDTVFEVDEKLTAWLEAGAVAVWIVNPKRRTVTIHRAGAPPRTLSENESLTGEDVVAGFSLPVGEILTF